MEKKTLIIGVIALVVVALIFIAYSYFNPEKPKPTNGEFITTLDLNSFCGLQDEKTCNLPMPCEGERVNLMGYTKSNDMELRGLSGEGMAKTSLPIIYLDTNTPKNWTEYYKIRDNNFWSGIVITGDSSVSAKALKEKLEALGVAEDEPILVKVKNAKIVGYDMPTMNTCTRGIGLEVSLENIVLEKISN